MSEKITAVATYSARPLIASDFLQQENDQRNLIGAYIQQQMRVGVDYGVIPGGRDEKTLLKPGAEKLTTLFRCVPKFMIEEQIENWETGLFYYRFRCQILTQADQSVVAEGVGSCSSYESKYRWRKADRRCPMCGVAAITRSKYPPRNSPNAQPGWYCFAKKNGCGANFTHDDPAITSQTTDRIPNPDIHDCVNTVLKMAKKRAHVDAAISLARCSDIFTQDVEDFIPTELPPHQTPTSEQPQTQERADHVEREPGIDPEVMVADATREKMIGLLHQLGKSWRDPKVLATASDVLGREIKPGTPASDLTEAEAMILIAELELAVQKRAAKTAAKQPA
jgi:hypothetical protein